MNKSDILPVECSGIPFLFLFNNLKPFIGILPSP